uniref:Uncharacterized protein n=1 Tax=Arundo donax TaxID=35708 RepID=A0A0A9HML0_ARUDO
MHLAEGNRSGYTYNLE